LEEASLPTITVQITTDDLRHVGCSCTGACVVGRALRRLGLTGDVLPDRIRLFGGAQGQEYDVDVPGQLRRFMRLLDQGIEMPPPTVVIEVPDGWGFPDPEPG
jgi:hypothetical protein